MPKIPGVNHLDAVRALEKAGFRILRQGKHIVMSDGVRILTIPRHNPVNAFTMGGIARDAGLTGAVQDLSLNRTPSKRVQLTGISRFLRQFAARCSCLPAAESAAL